MRIVGVEVLVEKLESCRGMLGLGVDVIVKQLLVLLESLCVLSHSLRSAQESVDDGRCKMRLRKPCCKVQASAWWSNGPQQAAPCNNVDVTRLLNNLTARGMSKMCCRLNRALLA